MHRYLLFVSRAYSFEILRPLAQAARARGEAVKWFVHGVPVPADLAPQVLADVAAVKAYNPQAVFAPGNWVADFFPGVKVQVFHGFGIEKKGHFRIRGFFDLYCTHGPRSTHGFESLRARHAHFAVRETGWPKMDPLFEPTERSRALRRDGSRPVILFAPTFSPALSCAPALYQIVAELARRGDSRWLLKFHPRMDPAEIERYRALSGPGLELCDDQEIVPLLQAADVLVSDTSSVVTEFLLLDKPVVTYRTRAPGGHVLDIRDATGLGAALDHALLRPPGLMRGARDFVDAMHPYTDGRSSQRVLDAARDFIEQGGQQSLRAKPLNLQRRLAVRRRMRYYRWH